MSDARNELQKTREAIDALDREIVRLLQDRARHALSTARSKHALGLPILDETREEGILSSLGAAQGPLDGEALKRIYRIVMEEMRQAEKKG
jgi:chorismate mutase